MAYGSEVVACGDDFVPGTEVPGFYLEALCASFGLVGRIAFPPFPSGRMGHPFFVLLDA